MGNLMKMFKRILLLLLPSLFALSSCSETDDAVVYDTWAIENNSYMETIAAEAGANESGEWKKFLSYGLDGNKSWDASYYVYCKVLQSGTVEGSPLCSDVVSVNYSGRLIDGTIFDKTYIGELNVDEGTPVELELESCVRGFVMALQEMKRGDVWEIYIPSELGYGSSAYVTSTTTIPAGSVLIFTVNLVDFAHSTATEE